MQADFFLTADRKNIETSRPWNRKRLEAGDWDVFVSEKEEEKYQTIADSIKMFDASKAPFQKLLHDGEYYLDVFAGSGLYRNKRLFPSSKLPTLMDWALINIEPGQMGDNKVCLYHCRNRLEGHSRIIGQL